MTPASSTTLVVSLAVAALGLLGLTALVLRSPDAPRPPAASPTGSSAKTSTPTTDSAGARTAVASRPEVSEVREGFRVTLAEEARQAAESPDAGSSPQASTSQNSANRASAANTGTTTTPSSFSSVPAVAAPSAVASAQTALPLAQGSVLADVPVTAETRLWLPAAMLEPDKSIPISTELQVAEWERLQDLFVSAVGGRAPGDQASREVWVRAQQESDDRFRQKFGWDAFRAQQMKAYKEGLAPNF